MINNLVACVSFWPSTVNKLIAVQMLLVEIMRIFCERMTTTRLWRKNRTGLFQSLINIGNDKNDLKRSISNNLITLWPYLCFIEDAEYLAIDCIAIN